MAYAPPSVLGGSSGGVPQLPAGYADAVSAGFSPYFQQSQDALQGTLASEGILSSGAGAKQLQDLTAKNNATYAQALQPLITQGFGQQFQAQQQNQTLAQQAQEFNANANNTFANNQMGYANQDYLAQLGQLAGLYGTGLSSQGNILSGGSNNATNGYQFGGQQGAQYAQQAGYSPYGGSTSGYNGPGNNGSGGIAPGSYPGGYILPTDQIAQGGWDSSGNPT